MSIPKMLCKVSPSTFSDATCVNAPVIKLFSGNVFLILSNVVDLPQPPLPCSKPPYFIIDLMSSSSNISLL